MESTSAVEIRVASSHGAGESDERMRLEVAHAHALGMKVALKPHLWIRRGEWQGAIEFASVESFRTWFKSYRAFILRYAALAESDGYDMLVLGTELKSATACDPECWRALIAELRAVYHGPLDVRGQLGRSGPRALLERARLHRRRRVRAHRHQEWGQGARAVPGVERAGQERLEALSKRTGKRVILTEIGYRATRDAAMAPATWPESDRQSELRRRRAGVVLPRRVLDAVGATLAGRRLRVEVVHR